MCYREERKLSLPFGCLLVVGCQLVDGGKRGALPEIRTSDKYSTCLYFIFVGLHSMRTCGNGMVMALCYA